MHVIPRFPVVLAMAAVLPAGLGAQDESAGGQSQEVRTPAQLIGQVVDASTGRAVDGAVVSLLGSGYGAITDSTGNFRIPQTFAGMDTLEVRFIGFEPSRTAVELAPNETTRVTLLLSPQAVRVADLTIEVRRSRRSLRLQGFLERRQRGFGVFLTPRDIRNRNPRLPSDLLRGLPGVTVGRIEYGKAQVYMGRGARRDCKPAVYLDGVYQSRMDVDDIPPEDLGAMEIYRGISDIPAEFMRTGTVCGAIVIWTPDGPDFMDWDPDIPDPIRDPIRQ